MKFIVALWKFLSFPLVLGGGALLWYGIHNWTAGTADVVMDGKTLLSSRPEAAKFRDSVDFDLSTASLRQSNVMGVKSRPLAAFPVWIGADTGAIRLIAVSAKPRFLGPVVQGFLRVDSTAGELKVRSTETASEGTLQPQFDAMVQVLAVKLKDDLGGEVRGRILLEGVALRQTDSSRSGIAGVAPEYWEIHTGGVPSPGTVYACVGGGVASILLGVVFQVAAGRWDRRRSEEEEEERQNEKPLV
ncbi:MAG TPA: hypothetical protein VN931_03010 [Fibrobacteria bacterium]|nr:hypothetical protein [Fibrobacteria bacterium]